MLILTMRPKPGAKHMQEGFLYCPKCGRAANFEYAAPAFCTHCTKALPNVALMLRFTSARIQYYKNGVTIGSNRQMYPKLGYVFR